MTREEHAELVNQIRTATSEVERNTLLADLVSDYETMTATISEHTSRIAQLENDNTEYAKLNNKLFLQLGTPTLNNTPQNEPPQNEPPQKRSYDDLNFD